ncbi:MAG: cupin domain-containing protein [Cephaloticoccus sp.]|nr:cupin domain-containing protein [Cephaloticoccus sp.]MCF7759017.1 cupin domain-containing protein [Cephaloticoccus sp.]
MKEFPAFMRQAPNAVAGSNLSEALEGYVFEGRDGTQIVLWQCQEGGTSPTHSHEYDEYAVLLSGTFTGFIGTQAVTMGPGDECHIPAGTPHSGSYSAGYRAIDAFGGKRVVHRDL